MLKTNSKKARGNIQKYILNNFNGEEYTETPPQVFGEVAAFILEAFRKEKYSLHEDFRYYRNNEQAAFIDWAAGLPNLLDTCYYCNRSAVDDLGEILEETEKEKSRYNQQQAEKLLTTLIYSELKKGAAKR